MKTGQEERKGKERKDGDRERKGEEGRVGLMMGKRIERKRERIRIGRNYKRKRAR